MFAFYAQGLSPCAIHYSSFVSNLALKEEGKGSEIKKFFEFPVQRDAQNQGQLGGRTELSGLDGTDRVPGHTDHLGQLALRELLLCTRFFQMIFEDESVVQAVTALMDHGWCDQIVDVAYAERCHKQCQEDRVDKFSALSEMQIFNPRIRGIAGKGNGIDSVVDTAAGKDLRGKEYRSQNEEHDNGICGCLSQYLQFVDIFILIFCPAFA